MNQEKYIDDLKEIKKMMNRSSRFISISGLSGISAGMSALIGVFAAHRLFFVQYPDLGFERIETAPDSLRNLLLIAVATMIVAIGTGMYFTKRETEKQNQKAWDHRTKRLLFNLAIPLFTGGIICLMFLFKGFIGLLAPLTLIFYGLGLVNASKYTLDEIRGLGLMEIALGLIALQFTAYALWFWAIGFGILHIVYGIIIPMKEKS